MAKLLAQGMNYRQIGEIYGLHGDTVGARLRNMSNSPVGHGTKTTRVDKKRLISSYQVQRIPIPHISKQLGIAVGSVQKLLKRYQIPGRSALPKRGKNIDLLRELPIGKAIEIKCISHHTPESLRRAARNPGIKTLIFHFVTRFLLVSQAEINYI